MTRSSYEMFSRARYSIVIIDGCNGAGATTAQCTAADVMGTPTGEGRLAGAAAHLYRGPSSEVPFPAAAEEPVAEDWRAWVALGPLPDQSDRGVRLCEVLRRIGPARDRVSRDVHPTAGIALPGRVEGPHTEAVLGRVLRRLGRRQDAVSHRQQRCAWGEGGGGLPSAEGADLQAEHGVGSVDDQPDPQAAARALDLAPARTEVAGQLDLIAVHRRAPARGGADPVRQALQLDIWTVDRPAALRHLPTERHAHVPDDTRPPELSGEMARVSLWSLENSGQLRWRWRHSRLGQADRRQHDLRHGVGVQGVGGAAPPRVPVEVKGLHLRQ